MARAPGIVDNVYGKETLAGAGYKAVTLRGSA
jgi:hypothetical protein